jgi:membrane-associated protease RseP (regulator of RpoE activity)
VTGEQQDHGYPSQPTSFEPQPYGGFVWAPPPRPKFRHPYGRHLSLFFLTFLTTTFAPGFAVLFFTFDPLSALTLFSWSAFRDGIWYSIPLLTILSAHEFGHYFACRYHNVDATLPYFLPVPLPLTGTLGAVIRIREVFPSRRALFDIGVAGPLAGFVALLPLLYWGVTLSTVGPIPEEGGLFFGEPLLWKALEYVHFGALPDSMDVIIHPMAFAAWFGMLATALNLLPFGQLDGGHIMYANVGRRAAAISMVTLGFVLALSILSRSWIAMAVMMTTMAFFFGFRHPRVIGEDDVLDRKRRVLSVLAVIVFVLCFTPAPITIMGF